MTAQQSPNSQLHRFLRALAPALVVLLFAAALLVLRHTLRQYHYRDIVRTIAAIPHRQIAYALALTALSYLTLTVYDVLAFRYIRHPLLYRKIGFASFIGYAFSNNMGFANLAGGSVRYRLYSLWGLSALQVAKVVAFCALTFWMGFLALGGLVFTIHPLPLPRMVHVALPSVRPIGVVFLCLVGAYLTLVLARKTPLRFRGLELAIPGAYLFCGQVVLASLDWLLAAGVLYSLMPPEAHESYALVVGIFLIAQVAGLLSHVPGGVGVFETVVLFFMPATAPTLEVTGGLLAYRVIYYLLPLGLAATLMGGYEIRQRQAGVKRVAQSVGQWAPMLVPQFLAATSFLSGALLLFSGATPTEHSRLKWLVETLSLPVLEFSHFLGSVVGVGLLLLARGLQRRLDAAYFLALGFLATGALLSLLKGFDYEEAIVLAIMFAALLPCRRHFYRKTSLVMERFTPMWLAAIAMVVLSSVWLGAFSNKHVEYSHDLWWHFSLKGDAPRFLRATVGAMGALLFFSLARLLSPARPEAEPAGQSDPAEVRAIVSAARHTSAHLALLGDKELLFSESRRSFLMYAVEGRSWVALGDPVGPAEEQAELVWAFRDLCDRHGGWPVFYQVQSENVHLYLDLGLPLLKLGEEARVPLSAFTLEGRARRDLRAVMRKFEREACRFEIVRQEEATALLPEMRRVSDAWLADKHGREKGFSLGWFQEDYLAQFPVALVRLGDELVAFANIWPGGDREELSLDLMRHAPHAPNGTMEYLFVKVLLWGKQEGYRWFNLGVAPLSGLENRALAPLWHRLGALVFQHGEHFYNFQGLRHYKEKFDPEWRPVYLASPGGLTLPRVLTNIAALISGGVKGIFTK